MLYAKYSWCPVSETVLSIFRLALMSSLTYVSCVKRLHLHLATMRNLYQQLLENMCSLSKISEFLHVGRKTGVLF